MAIVIQIMLGMMVSMMMMIMMVLMMDFPTQAISLSLINSTAQDSSRVRHGQASTREQNSAHHGHAPVWNSQALMSLLDTSARSIRDAKLALQGPTAPFH